MNYKNLITFLIVSFAFVMFSCKDNSSKPKATTVIATDVNTGTIEDYSSKMTKADKKKYFDASNNVAFEIKYKPDGFKLRTASSQLLWKIKLYGDKIKISDNEENLNPYEIKITETQRAKLVKDGTTIAKTSYDAAKKQQVLAPEAGTPEFISQSYTSSLLVTQIPEIPKIQKDIIIKELILKGY